MRLLIDRLLGKLRQQFVGFRLLIQRFLQQLLGFIVSEPACVGSSGAVSGYLIVFHTLRRSNERRVQHFIILHALNRILSLLDKPLHRRTLLTGRGIVQILEDLLEALNLTFRLLDVIVKGLLQLVVRGLVPHLRERTHQLFLGAVQVF